MHPGRTRQSVRILLLYEAAGSPLTPLSGSSLSSSGPGRNAGQRKFPAFIEE